MQRAFRTFAALAAALTATIAFPVGAAADGNGSFTLTRHRTTNALDGPLALDDWYTTLRGAFDGAVEHEKGTTRLATDFELRRYDTYEIENDAQIGISAETTMRASERVELRGTLTFRATSEGDDLPVEDFIVGTRTRKAIFGAALQAGFQLTPDTVLVFDAGASHEKVSDTEFQDGVIEPVRLQPDRDRLGLGAALVRTHGAFSFGAAGSAAYLRIGAVEPLPVLELAEYTAKLQAAAKLAGGVVLRAEAGVQMLDLLNGTFRDLRPVYALSAETPLDAGLSLRGAVRASFDTASADDPLASWVRRMEAEGGYELAAGIRLGVGAFREIRDNLVLGSRETARGYFGEIVWKVDGHTTLLVRIDATRSRFSGIAAPQDTIDTQVALTRRL